MMWQRHIVPLCVIKILLIDLFSMISQKVILWGSHSLASVWRIVSRYSFLIQTIELLLPEFLRRRLAAMVHLKYLQPLNLSKIIDEVKPKGLAFIYHMGIGDALFTTPFLFECKRRWPELPIWTYVSSQLDTVNSPVVAEVLDTIPYVDRVDFFPGAMREVWTNYDRSAVQGPEDFLTVPILWRAETTSRHRTEQIFTMFGLSQPQSITPLVFPPLKPTPLALSLASESKKADKIALLHLDTRSSEYLYPDRSRLAEILMHHGWKIFSFTPLDRYIPEVEVIDVGKMTFSDTLSFLVLICNNQKKIRGVCAQSMFWPLLSAFNIPAIGLNIIRDDGIHAYWNPEITVLSAWKYSGVKYKIFISEKKRIRKYRSKYSKRTFSVIDYDVDEVASLFLSSYEEDNCLSPNY